jgi:hypothetical protein
MPRVYHVAGVARGAAFASGWGWPGWRGWGVRRTGGPISGAAIPAGPPPGVIRLPRLAGTGDMVRVGIAGHPLTATAALVWHGDLPRPLQQILFDAADRVTPPPPASLSRAG